jgi:hypothetical protein
MRPSGRCRQRTEMDCATSRRRRASSAPCLPPQAAPRPRSYQGHRGLRSFPG